MSAGPEVFVQYGTSGTVFPMPVEKAGDLRYHARKLLECSNSVLRIAHARGDVPDDLPGTVDACFDGAEFLGGYALGLLEQADFLERTEAAEDKS